MSLRRSVRIQQEVGGVDVRKIQRETIANGDYRRVIYTYPNKFQLVLMSLDVGETIPREMHEDTVQFIRVESGRALAIVGNGTAARRYTLHAGDTITIGPRRCHEIRNDSKTSPLKLYTIYTPPEHDTHGIQHRQQ